MGASSEALKPGKIIYWFFPLEDVKLVAIVNLIFRGIAMGKPVISRDAFRGLFAFYAAKAHHDREFEGEYSLLKLFGSADDIPDSLLLLWSDKVELLGSETVGRLMEPRARSITEGNARYDHASDFLHTLLRDLRQKEQ